MRYTCINCGNGFEREDGFRFCPCCGSWLDGEKNAGSDSALSVAGMIDFVWGEKAEQRSEFERVIRDCISKVNWYGEFGIICVLPRRSITKFKEAYEHIKQSSNRKVLIHRIDEFIASLDRVLDSLQDEISDDKVDKLKQSVDAANEMCRKLYGFVGLGYALPEEATFDDLQNSVQLMYSKGQLRALYALVLAAYEKYKKCVEDNNMFAAFASDSDYGSLRSLAFSQYRRRFGEDEEESLNPKNAESAYQEIMEYMTSHNAEKYMGLLDEDFVPHVDAFWHGLEVLCGMIDDHVSVAYEKLQIRIDEEEEKRILHLISGQDFEVNAEKVEQAYALKKQFEER